MSDQARICPHCHESFGPDAERCPVHGVRLLRAMAEVDRTGDVIDERFTLTGVLGSGGMARVYRARQHSIDRDVAIKLLRPTLSDSSQRVRRFLKEVRTASCLNHPHIVKLFDFGQTTCGELYVVMELLEGGSLRHLIVQGVGLYPVRACEIMLQICDAVQYAHDQGLVHRDLKPDNVMVREGIGSSGDFATVLDFGVAKVLAEDPEATSLTRTGTSCGTPAYMSPEQAACDEIDERSDVYALGVIFYQMLSGRLPFQAESSLRMALAHVQQQPRPLPERVEPFLRAIVMQAMAKSPDLRPRSAAQMREQILGAMVELGWRQPRDTQKCVVPIGAVETITHEAMGSVDTAAAIELRRLATAERIPVDQRPSTRRRFSGTAVALAGVLLLAAPTLVGGGEGERAPTPASSVAADGDEGTAAPPTRAPTDPAERSAGAVPPATLAMAGVDADAAPAPEAVSRTIELTTRPAGARVLDGEALLGETPLHVPRPAPGVLRTLRIELSGRTAATLALDSTAANRTRVVLDAPESARGSAVKRSASKRAPRAKVKKQRKSAARSHRGRTGNRSSARDSGLRIIE